MSEGDIANVERVFAFALEHWQALGLAGLVLPGFVAFLTYDLLVPSQRKNLGESTVELVTFGVVNALVAMAIFQWGPIGVGLVDSRGAAFLAGICFLFVGPFALGVAAFWFRRRKVVQMVLPHPTPSPWDYAFETNPRALVLCHLKSGKRIGGVFAGQSFRTTFGESNDIYLEKQLVVDSEGAFVGPVPLSSGVLVSRDECEFVELYELKERENADTSGNLGASEPPGHDGSSARGGTTGGAGAGTAQSAEHPDAAGKRRGESAGAADSAGGLTGKR